MDAKMLLIVEYSVVVFVCLNCVYGRHLQIQLTGYECFYDSIDANVSCSLEYAPITGANPQLDAFIEAPQGQLIYKAEKKDYDLFRFVSEKPGVYRFCFSNVYDSVFQTNLVYFDFVKGKGDDTSFPGASTQTALTQMETTAYSIHEALAVMEQYQNHHRIREANGRIAAETLNSRVQWWSLSQAFVIVLVSLLQVFVLRRFFTIKRENI
ncbi:transmembrane emp24 domain-containing protein 7-like [Dendronephthya gigantea]|uniref:transmembrane emp24 domain-containing protein 7-like n=1 Tax=Dendronephthya gigantea TaxID=151771 RepID=UPI00106B5FB9|nr:transmembrane emp24 domain-containing protein 7-like [Dendronephthya gigantea]